MVDVVDFELSMTKYIPETGNKVRANFREDNGRLKPSGISIQPPGLHNHNSDRDCPGRKLAMCYKTEMTYNYGCGCRVREIKAIQKCDSVPGTSLHCPILTPNPDVVFGSTRRVGNCDACEAAALASAKEENETGEDKERTDEKDREENT